MSKLDDETIRTPIILSNAVGDSSDPDSNRIAEVIAVEIHLNIFIMTGNLDGVKKPLFTIGQMTGEFIKTIKAFQKHVVGLPHPDGRVDPNGKTLKYLNGPLTARGGKVDAGSSAPPATVMAARTQIAEAARALLKEGGHFLMGAMGDMPGRANGHPVRPAFTLPATFMKQDHATQLGPAVNAAWASTGKFGKLGCMGRPDKRSIANAFIAQGSAEMAQVHDYCACIGRMNHAGIPSTRWPGYDRFRDKPHLFRGASVFSELIALAHADPEGGAFPRKIQPHGDIFLGESCVGRRHYDCIGFVNFVLSKVLSSDWAQAMTFYMSSSTRFKVTALGGKASVFDLAQPGDLVFKSESEAHCGVCTLFDGKVVVTNCRNMALGLINSPLKDEWAFHARLISV